MRVIDPKWFYVGPLADEMHRSYSPIFTQCIRSGVTHSLFTAMGSGGWELEIRSMFFACCRVCELLIFGSLDNIITYLATNTQQRQHKSSKLQNARK